MEDREPTMEINTSEEEEDESLESDGSGFGMDVEDSDEDEFEFFFHRDHELGSEEDDVEMDDLFERLSEDDDDFIELMLNRRSELRPRLAAMSAIPGFIQQHKDEMTRFTTKKPIRCFDVGGTVPHFQCCNGFAIQNIQDAFILFEESLYAIDFVENKVTRVIEDMNAAPLAIRAKQDFVIIGTDDGRLFITRLKGFAPPPPAEPDADVPFVKPRPLYETYATKVTNTMNNSIEIFQWNGQPHVIVGCNDYSVRVFAVASNSPDLFREIGKIQLPTAINDARLSPDGRFLACVGDSDNLFLVDFPQFIWNEPTVSLQRSWLTTCQLQTERRTDGRPLGTSTHQYISWNRTSSLLAIGCDQDNLVLIFGINERSVIRKIITPMPSLAVCFHPHDEHLLAFCTRFTAHLVDVRTAKQDIIFPEAQISLILPGRRTRIPRELASRMGSHENGMNALHPYPICGIAFSPSGNSLFIATTVRIFEHPILTGSLVRLCASFAQNRLLDNSLSPELLEQLPQRLATMIRQDLPLSFVS